jgi:hypothetical protein
LQDGAIHLCGFVDCHPNHIFVITYNIGRNTYAPCSALPLASAKSRLRHNQSRRRSLESTRHSSTQRWRSVFVVGIFSANRQPYFTVFTRFVCQLLTLHASVHSFSKQLLND